MPPLVANARMYAVTPAVGEAWKALFEWVAREAAVPLTVLEHAAPAPLEELWTRDDLGLAFMCGYPFARRHHEVQSVAAPLTIPQAGAVSAERGPIYHTDLVVRAEGPLRSLSDAFAGRLGWTVEHSQSGFNAVRHHLLGHRKTSAPTLFKESVGPLLTPRRVIEAVLSGEIDVGPLDSYFHDLLRRHEPQTAAGLRTLETTISTPMPLLVASATVPSPVVEALSQALVRAASDPGAAPLLRPLSLTGFATVDPASYEALLAQAAAAEAADYPVPA